MNKKWFAALAACALVLFAAGCSNGSDGSGETEPEPIAVASVDVSKKKLPLEVGVMEKLDVRILPAEAAGVTVRWSSSKPAVATVGNDGTVKAVKVGTAVITAQAGDKEDTCEVTVSAHSHYYVNWKCTTCGLDKPSFQEGDIDDRGNLTAYTGNGTTVEIPKGVTCIGSGVFKDCTSLTSVTIPEGMTRIESSAFKGCTGLASVTIPDGVTYIEYQAFEGCTSLASVTIPDSVTYIGSYAFSECTSLKEIRFTGTMAEWNAINGSDRVNITRIRCSNGNVGVEEVPEYLTMNGTIVTGYTGELPAGLTIPDGVTAIGQEAFENCKTLTSVKIPDSVKSIGYNAFSGCTSLTSVTIPDGVKSIGQNTFNHCTSLTSVTIPDSVTEIDNEAFSGCTGLKEVTIGDGLESIKYAAFYECSNLTSVTIGDGLESIEYAAFYGCTKLTEVKYLGTEEEWNNIKGLDDSYLSGKTIYGKDSDGNEVTWKCN